MKQQRLMVVLVVLLVIAGLVWFRYLKSDSTVLTADASSNTQDQPLPVDNPRLRLEEIGNARKTEYRSSGRNIFVAQAAAPVLVAQAQQKPKPRKVGPEPPPPEPPPPPLTLPPNMKFYGYGTVPNGTGRRAFFTDGEEVYVVPESGLLLNRFRILKIGNSSLEFEEVSTGRRGTAPLEEQAAPSGPSA